MVLNPNKKNYRNLFHKDFNEKINNMNNMNEVLNIFTK